MKKILIYLVKLYQKYLSPDHSYWAKKMNKPPYCKHIPSCSEYMIESIQKKWVIVWIPKWIWRILRCQPFFKWGYDPVEKIKTKKNNNSNSKILKTRKFIQNHSRIFSYSCIILIIYMSLIVCAKKIQTISTFPATIYNVQDFVWHIDATIDFEEINITSSNWYNINWLYTKALSWSYDFNQTPKTIYYFHWNGWPLSYFYSEIKYITSLGYNVFTYDFPGYWKSTWVPYKKNIEIFSKEFYEYIKKEKWLKSEELIIWWYSIWTAVAVDFANKNNVEKIILVSPISSRYDMSKKLFWFAIQKILFLKNSFVSESFVKDFNKPVLIIHWNNDKIVPFEQWLKVYNNYWLNYLKNWLGDRIKKNFIEIDNTGHNYIIDNYWEILKYQFLDFLNTWRLEIKELFIDKNKIEELKEKNNLKSYNLKNDDSLTKFVNNKISFNEPDYIPNNLENISSDYIFDIKWNWKLYNKANIALQKLAKDFYTEFSKKISIVSSYRSYEYQVWIKKRWCPDNLCAKPWFSEHQSGLAIDIFSASTKQEWDKNVQYQKYFEWFNQNAHKYWFHNTYQKWLQIDWYEIEPWHWRYLWIDLASYLKKEGITIAEFYQLYPPFVKGG